MSEIRHIVFDLGRVLVQWDPERPYLRLIPDAAKRKRFLEDVCNAHWLMDTDRGATWPDAEAELIARFPDDEAMIRAFRVNWHEMLPGEVEGTPAILDALLEAGHDVTALTNFADDTFDEAALRFPRLTSFRGVTVSARVKLLKPERAIYERHVRDWSLEPAATLFFDDNPDNVVGAREAGWNAELFTGADRMRTDLKRYGVAF